MSSLGPQAAVDPATKATAVDPATSSRKLELDPIPKDEEKYVKVPGEATSGWSRSKRNERDRLFDEVLDVGRVGRGVDAAAFDSAARRVLHEEDAEQDGHQAQRRRQTQTPTPRTGRCRQLRAHDEAQSTAD